MKKVKVDARKLSANVLEAKRKEAIKLRERGIKNSEVSKIVGISEQTISALYSKYKREDKKYCKLKKRGRPRNTGRKLEDALEQKIIQLLIETKPDQTESIFALWTRESVKDLILRDIGIKMPISTVGDYLKRWELISRDPISKVKSRKNIETERWLAIEYHRIKKEAMTNDGNILWIDHFPTSPLNLKITMIYAVTKHRKTMFSLYDGNMNGEKFINFMQRVIDSFDKKVYLILDSSKVHNTKVIREWVRDHNEQIEIFLLPPFS